MKDKITVIGSLNYDIILKVKRLPEKGETMTAESAGFSAGGKGANQAVQAAKPGIPTYMVGCVGKDSMGDYLIETAKRHGVCTDHIRRSDENTGMGMVQALEDGSVYAVIARGANYSVSREDVDNAKDLLKESSSLILQMEIPQEVNEYAIRTAGECGCRVIMNAAPAAKISDDALSMCDIVAVNEVEAAFYCGTPVDSVEKAKSEIAGLCARYGNSWIFTLGASGSVLSDGKKTEFIPSMKVKAVETTGAGDSYIGGFAYALQSGKDFFDAGKFATCCSAVTVCRVGAQDSMPVLKEAMEIYDRI